jgi:hemolysin activation/secretion protein
VYANFTGQSAAKNLDSSEKFALGGMGVRAYPQGEASGDAGALLNLEARYNIPGFEFGNLQLVGFYDYGSIKLHKTTWAGWQPIGLPNFPNSYSLSGAGFGLNVYKENDFSVRSSVAWKVGSNPGRDALGRDSDSESKSLRFWLQLSKQF